MGKKQLDSGIIGIWCISLEFKGNNEYLTENVRSLDEGARITIP
jgi:hypothetical protein